MLFLLLISLCSLIVVVAVYSEEEEWSDEFEDFVEETTPGFSNPFFLIYFEITPCKFPLKQEFQNLLVYIYLSQVERWRQF